MVQSKDMTSEMCTECEVRGNKKQGSGKKCNASPFYTWTRVLYVTFLMPSFQALQIEEERPCGHFTVRCDMQYKQTVFPRARIFESAVWGRMICTFRKYKQRSQPYKARNRVLIADSMIYQTINFSQRLTFCTFCTTTIFCIRIELVVTS